MAANLTENGMTPNQEAALLGLLNEPTIRKAAATCGISERTLYKWLDDPAFLGMYRKLRREAFAQAMGQLQRYAPLAAQVLAKIAADESAPASARVTAASALLKHARDGIELDDLAARVEALERAAPPAVKHAA